MVLGSFLMECSHTQATAVLTFTQMAVACVHGDAIFVLMAEIRFVSLVLYLSHPSRTRVFVLGVEVWWKRTKKEPTIYTVDT